MKGRPPAGETEVGANRCPVCGKTIYTTAQWAYQRREKNGARLYFCSWSHLRRWDAAHELTGERKYKRNSAGGNTCST